MFRIKICGITQAADLDHVAQAGADAVGLNFHPASVRYVTAEQAAELRQRADSLGLTSVGVFVEASGSEILSMAERVGLRSVQLHGEQTHDDVNLLLQHGFEVIRVVRLPQGPLDEQTIEHLVSRWSRLGCPLLLDAQVGVHGGGRGARLDWDAVGRWSRKAVAANPSADRTVLTSEPSAAEQQSRAGSGSWAMAGGLTPELVSEAIERSGAPRIDVASGVESAPGRKSHQKVLAFVSAAEAAWGRVSPLS